MKHFFILLLVLCFNIGSTPLSTLYANAVPVEMTSHKKSKKINQKRQQSFKKHYKKQFKYNRKKQAPKPEQQNYYYGGAFIYILVPVYLVVSITLLVLGIVFALPGLWITAICLLAAALIYLIYLLGIYISAAIDKRKIRVQQLKRNREWNEKHKK